MRSAIFLALVVTGTPVLAADVHRCANGVYQETPCPGEAPVARAAPPKPVQAVPSLPVSPHPAPPENEFTHVKPGDPGIATCRQQGPGFLKDPESARFRDSMVLQWEGSPGELRYIIEVNAKNSFGGYNGFATFACHLTPDKAHVTSFVPFP